MEQLINVCCQDFGEWQQLHQEDVSRLNKHHFPALNRDNGGLVNG
jgi:hypothetical protein